MCKKVLAYKVNMCEYMGVMENKQKMENKMKKNKNTLPTTFGLPNLPKRTNKQRSPRKFDMWSFLSLKGMELNFQDSSMSFLKRKFEENGGLEWWNNKKENK